jgi:GTP-binding protein YchF
VGPPKSGKTTIFNALTRSSALVTEYASGKVEPNISVVEVHDERVARLREMYEPKRTIFATIDFMDFVGVAGSAAGAAPAGGAQADLWSGPALGLVKTADALAAVVRNFRNDVLDSTLGEPDPVRDARAIAAELILADLVLVETRIQRIEADHGRGRKTPQSQAELAVLHALADALNGDTPLRDVSLNHEQRRAVSGFQFLSQKPLMVVLNSSEELYGRSQPAMEALEEEFTTVEFAGSFEMELARLDEDEAQLFMEDLGIERSARSRLTTLAYESLGLISFFTASEDEVRAWTIRSGETAVDAAGTVHSDLARGFIRAECFSYEDLMEAGSEKGVRQAGHFRLEGKDYPVKDGDILRIRFSV